LQLNSYDTDCSRINTVRSANQVDDSGWPVREHVRSVYILRRNGEAVHQPAPPEIPEGAVGGEFDDYALRSEPKPEVCQHFLDERHLLWDHLDAVGAPHAAQGLVAYAQDQPNISERDSRDIESAAADAAEHRSILMQEQPVSFTTASGDEVRYSVRPFIQPWTFEGLTKRARGELAELCDVNLLIRNGEYVEDPRNLIPEELLGHRLVRGALVRTPVTGEVCRAFMAEKEQLRAALVDRSNATHHAVSDAMRVAGRFMAVDVTPKELG
jgi:hypothetical protein